MIKFEDEMSCVKAERSLLMSYCANLSFFEREVLPYLQQECARRSLRSTCNGASRTMF
jgi:hypothetical protein